MSYADGLLATGERALHREKQHWWVFVWGARFTILAVIIAVVFFILGANLSEEGASGTARTILSWVTAVLFIGGLALLGWTTLRYLNQEYVITNRRVIQVEGVINKRAADSSLEKINDAVLEQSIFGRALGFGDLRILTASEAAISDFRMLRRPVAFKKAMLEAKHEYEISIERGGDPPVAPTPPMRAPTTTAAGAAVAPAAETPQPGWAAAGAATPPATAVTPAAPPAEAAPSTAPAPTPPSPVTDDTVTTPVPTPVTPAAAPPPMEPDELTRTLSSLADLRDRGAISAEEYERKKAEILGRL